MTWRVYDIHPTHGPVLRDYDNSPFYEVTDWAIERWFNMAKSMHQQVQWRLPTLIVSTYIGDNRTTFYRIAVRL